MTVENRSLSDFWRHDRSYERVGELISILGGANSLIGNMGSDIRAQWSTQGMSYTDLQGRLVALDFGPLVGEDPVFRGSKVDEVIGYAAHEGGHCIFTNPGKKEVITEGMRGRLSRMPAAFQADFTANFETFIGELCMLQNILEDAHVDARVADTWAVLGEYIRISRTRLAERTLIDLPAILNDPDSARNAVVNLWMSVALYDYKLPRGGDPRVRKAVLDLMRITRKAVTQQDGKTRQLMVFDVARLLWERFPVQSDKLPRTPGMDGDDSNGTGGASQPQPGGSPGQSQPQDGDPDQGETSPGQPDGQPDAGDAGSGSGDPGEERKKAGGALVRVLSRIAEAKENGEPGKGTVVLGDLADFDPADGEMNGGRVVIPAPQELVDAVLDAIDRELEDISAAVGEVLDIDPRALRADAIKARYDEAQTNAVIASVKDEIGDIGQAFRRQRDVSTHWLRGRPKGRLDDRRLHKVFLGDQNNRKQKTVLSQPDQDVVLLLDVSESMDDYQRIVNQTAAIFTEGLRQVRGINFAALAYTTLTDAQRRGHMTLALTRLTDAAMGGKLHLGGITRSGATPSGMGIAGAKAFMETMPGRKKLLIHFTDGYPQLPALVHTALRKCRASGIQVYAVGMKYHEDKLRTQYGAGNYETIGSVPELTDAVARIVKKLGAPQV